MENAINFTQLAVAITSVVVAIGVPIAIGLFNVLKSINQTNTRLAHIEKNQDNAQSHVAKIPAIESRLRSLEQSRSDQLPTQTQMIQTLSSIDAKLDGQAGRMKSFEHKFDQKFALYDVQRAEFFEKYGHILTEQK